MKIINSDLAPNPAGHYEQAIAHNGLLWISGQLPIDPSNHSQSHGTIAEQTLLVLRNLERIALAGDSSRENILRVTLYVTDIELWPRVNTTYAEFFGNHRPARTVVPVPTLHHSFLIEADAVAALPTNQ